MRINHSNRGSFSSVMKQETRKNFSELVTKKSQSMNDTKLAQKLCSSLKEESNAWHPNWWSSTLSLGIKDISMLPINLADMSIQDTKLSDILKSSAKNKEEYLKIYEL